MIWHSRGGTLKWCLLDSGSPSLSLSSGRGASSRPAGADLAQSAGM